MKQKIKIPIKDIILKKDNILEIAEYIFTLENKNYVNYKIKFKNGYEIESEDIKLFKDRKFEEYEIDYIKMYYGGGNLKNKVEIYIYNYDTREFSSIEIESDNENWIAIIEKNINEKISFCDKASKINAIFRNTNMILLISFILAIIPGIIMGNLCSKIINLTFEYRMMTTLTSGMLFFLIFLKLFIRFDKIFPSLEISISDKNNFSKKKRNNIITVVTCFLLPLFVSVIYDFIKLF